MKTIRLMEREDLEARYKAIINHDINKWLVLPNVSRIRTQKWLESVVIDDSRRDYVGVLDDQIFAFSGLIHINQLNRTAEIYIFLASPKYFSKGLGSWLLKETVNIGFKELGITKFFAKVVKENEQSNKYFLKNDFKQEGVLKKESWVNGEYHDIVLLAKIFKERI